MYRVKVIFFFPRAFSKMHRMCGFQRLFTRQIFKVALSWFLNKQTVFNSRLKIVIIVRFHLTVENRAIVNQSLRKSSFWFVCFQLLKLQALNGRKPEQVCLTRPTMHLVRVIVLKLMKVRVGLCVSLGNGFSIECALRSIL